MPDWTGLFTTCRAKSSGISGDHSTESSKGWGDAMLNLRQYEQLLDALRDATRLPELASLPHTAARVWDSGADPATVIRTGHVPAAGDMAPMQLATLWHGGLIAGFSLLIEDRV